MHFPSHHWTVRNTTCQIIEYFLPIPGISNPFALLGLKNMAGATRLLPARSSLNLFQNYSFLVFHRKPLLPSNLRNPENLTSTPVNHRPPRISLIMSLKPLLPHPNSGMRKGTSFLLPFSLEPTFPGLENQPFR